jgi:hypothetical protein
MKTAQCVVAGMAITRRRLVAVFNRAASISLMSRWPATSYRGVTPGAAQIHGQLTVKRLPGRTMARQCADDQTDDDRGADAG